MTLQVALEAAMPHGADDRQQRLHREDDAHGPIGNHLEARLFQRRRPAVPDHACVGSRVDDDTDAQGRVPQHRPPHEQLLPAQGLSGGALDLNAAVEVVDVGAGWLGDDLPGEPRELVERAAAVACRRRPGKHRLCRRRGCLQLEICLSVQVRSGHIAVPAIACAKEGDDVGGKFLVLPDDQDVTHRDLRPFPLCRLEAAGDLLGDGVVDLGIRSLSPHVVVEGHRGGDGHHHEQ
mmetsp:Transcript_96067/g.277443  ORF Transcript_96067/g.277443 Transcript_96067/m.277443 type:complete len:235 (-) Transcript_96067:316-1020(-)